MILSSGMEIEILAYKPIYGDELWQRYTITDAEIPRIGADGKWRFTAKSEYYSLGPSPMAVEADRIRLLK